MTARQAEREGLSFTGIYGRDSQEVNAQIARDKADAKRLGLKLRIVKVYESSGFSAYADQDEYNALRKLKSAETRKKIYLNDEKRIRDSKTKAVEEARAALARAEEELAMFEAELADAKLNLK